MVPLTAAALLGARIVELEGIVTRLLPAAQETSIGFVQGLLHDRPALFEGHLPPVADLDYAGIPALARSGFLALLGTHFDAARFTGAVDRLRGRPRGGRAQLCDDDLAVLGIATGIAALPATGEIEVERRRWLLDVSEGGSDPAAWSYRARQLASDLLDGAGRLRAKPRDATDSLAFELALRHAWPKAFTAVAPLDPERRQSLMASLLSTTPPADGELERAAVWLRTLLTLVNGASAELVPDFDVLLETLEATQSALRRWVWDERPNRNGIGPARWLIDAEAHVQSFLWTVLEPRFGDQLVDEQYLPGFGLKQPRADFGIVNLKTIVEVKLVRSPRDLPGIEEEVAGDLGLYFSEPERYDRMIVYVYDDSDRNSPERYDTLRSALQRRDARIGGVVVVQRPGMIPARGKRQPWTPDVGPFR